jgi:anti-sigma28 factor (negative regulator of flagellin synthesis)
LSIVVSHATITLTRSKTDTMSLRVQNDTAAGAASLEVGRASQSSSAASSASGQSRTVSGTDGVDHVDVSSSTESISAGISAQDAQHTARVAELGALVASGQYTSDSSQVSRAIIGNAITVSTAGRA